MHNVLRQLFLIIIFPLYQPKHFIRENKSFLVIQMKYRKFKFEIIDSENAIFKGQVRIVNEDALLATDI